MALVSLDASFRLDLGRCITQSMIPTVDFQRIRPFRGSQHLGFEELCCQLASLEHRATQRAFVRKGPGPDQGIECYATLPGGDEIGWQSKYFLNGFGDAQERQLDESLDRALVGHPKLSVYVVCLPMDLSDLRRGGKRSKVQRYESWRTRQIEGARGVERTIRIDLWSASQIAERLARDSPLYSGRLHYWFDERRLSGTWFASRFEVVKANLGERYTAECHVDLPIQRTLQALARDDWFATQAQGLAEHLSRPLREVLSGNSLAEAEGESLRVVSAALLTLLEAPVDPLDDYPIARAIACCKDAMGTLVAAMSSRDKERADRDVRSRTTSDMYELYGALQDIQETIKAGPWLLLNERKLLITGVQGAGKSHLLADFGARQISQAKPFVLVLTQTMGPEDDPWQQILRQLDLADWRVTSFLGALDAAAEANRCRAVIAVDALNERYGVQLWQTRLAGFLKQAEQFPHVSLIVSVRTTYERHFNFAALPKRTHHGYGEHAGAAAKAYMDKRGIARPSNPNLLAEFKNPLFLRTCCDYLDAEGLKALPK